MTGDYKAFLEAKTGRFAGVGFTPEDLNPHLMPFQRDIVRWACMKGRAAVFSDCGTGKSIMQLAWADAVSRFTGGNVLILAPLSVAQQTVQEAEKFGIEAAYSRAGKPAGRITTANYEMLHHFAAKDFAAVVLDECFPPDTLIDTPNGRMYIKDIRQGDTIHNASGIDEVSNVHRRKIEYAIRIRIGDRTITSSPNHPYFTQRGWVSAQDLQPGDSLVHTAEAVRMVRGTLHEADGATAQRVQVLRDILLSEMADAATGDRGEDPQSGSCGPAWQVEECMVQGWEPHGTAGTGEDSESDAVSGSGGLREDLPNIESHEARTFRAWGQWDRDDFAPEDLAGCTWTRLGSGVSFVTGTTDSGLSNVLQARLGAFRNASVYRGGWVLPRVEESAGCEEGRVPAFSRVDGLEVLEPGHPDLEQYRDASGIIYFYDLGGTRHPSFSIHGCLVHNSSILKAVDGKTRNQIIETFRDTEFRLACTATPAPNDFMELGNHSQFLGIMNQNEMLAKYFFHDGGETQAWTLKGHAEEEFWKWVCSWAVMLRKPSDIGHKDDGFVLPKLHTIQHTVSVVTKARSQDLFGDVIVANTLNEQRDARRESLSARVAECAAMVNADSEPWLVWCDLNAEGDALEAAIPGSVQVSGADDLDAKVEKIRKFLSGEARVLVTKPKVAGMGLNLQHCAKEAFVGVTHSFEAYYQAVRRCWRFGQAREVFVHLFCSEREGPVLESLRRKEEDASVMVAEMLKHVSIHQDIAQTIREHDDYNPQQDIRFPDWLIRKVSK